MQMNIILAGVGGQGILTTSRAISLTARRRGWNVKQAELHGMSQRGGAVQSHLRISDGAIHSDLIPLKEADLILAVEPLEALRYVGYLADEGVIVANTTPVENIPDYGSAEAVLARIAQRGRHILVNANRLASGAGSSRAVNMVMFGAAAEVLELPGEDCRASIAEMLCSKGAGTVETSLRAFELGRKAARLYQEGLDRGLAAGRVRARIEALSAGEIESMEEEGIDWEAPLEDPAGLSSAQIDVVDAILKRAGEEGRSQLLEPEVYSIIETVGAIRPPVYRMIVDPAEIRTARLAEFPGDRVVLKVVSPEIVHKSDAGGVAIVPKDAEIVAERAARMMAEARSRGARVDGILAAEYVAHEAGGLGGELFVGIRATREFGPVVAAGLGGVDTEYLAARLRPGAAVSKALATEATAESFLALFRETAAYEVLSGAARGHRRVVSDGALRRCFGAFIALARRYFTARADGGPELVELEVNPFAFRRGALVPLDGRGRIGCAARPTESRPEEPVDRLLEPRSIAVVGVSGKRRNFGRIILDNIRRCGFPLERLYVVKRGESDIDGVRCVEEVGSLPETVDVLVIAASAADVPRVVDEVLLTRRARAAIIITAGLGERAGTEGIHEELRRRIEQARRLTGEGPVFLGENCLGVRSRPGRYDTFFIEDRKLDPRRDRPARRLAIVSQSGAFAISRMANVPELDPALTISVGNQLDLTLSDLTGAASRRSDVDVIGVYAEGFRELDGLALSRAIGRATASGRELVFYKAGRTEPGRSATAGHTASIAGDYDVCLSAAEQAGALVTETVKEFEQVLELATAFHQFSVGGRRIAAVTNAGAEAVAMADAITGPRHAVELARWSEETAARVRGALEGRRLEGVVNASNPLDVTPMADDATIEACAEAMLEDPEVDALVVALVPLTTELRTIGSEVSDPRSLCNRLPALMAAHRKPVVFVMEAGAAYGEYVTRLRSGGVPVLPSCDQAMRSLGRYLGHRAGRRVKRAPGGESEEAGRAEGEARRAMQAVECGV